MRLVPGKFSSDDSLLRQDGAVSPEVDNSSIDSDYDELD
jgi:hypothetical protein